MKFKNTSKYPTAEVRALVDFGTKGVKLRKATVTVTNCSREYRGRAWHSYYYRILIRVGDESHFPVTVHYPRKKTAPTYEFKTWQEAVIGVSAHEARHVYQFKRKKICSEIDAERYALKRLELYRSLQ